MATLLSGEDATESINSDQNDVKGPISLPVLRIGKI
jgi:hypothetical protein